MSLKIRLSRVGTTHVPVYRIIVTETRSRRDGRSAETLGTYSPRSKKEPVKLDIERAEYWMGKGALCSDTVAGLYKKEKARKAATAATTTAAPAVTA